MSRCTCGQSFKSAGKASAHRKACAAAQRVRAEAQALREARLEVGLVHSFSIAERMSGDGVPWREAARVAELLKRSA